MGKAPLERNRECVVCGAEVGENRGKFDYSYCSKECESHEHGYSHSKLRKDELKARIMSGTSYAPPPLEPAKHLVTGYPTLIVNDPHCPMQSEKWTEQALIAADHFGCRTAVINGDLIDAAQIGRHFGKAYRGKANLEDDMLAAEKFVGLFCELFDEVYYTLGNHTERLMHRFNSELPIQRLLKMIYNSDNLHLTQKTWMKAHKNTIILHPRGYSKIRGKWTADLCQLKQKNIVTGHHHHSATSFSQDSNWQAIEVGCLVEFEKFGYVKDHMGPYAEMMNGFAIMFPDETFLNFNKHTPWKIYGLPEIK